VTANRVHFLGLQGMPRRIYTYQPEMPWGGLNLFVSLSACLLAAGFLLFFIDVLRSMRAGPLAGSNPWKAATLEWATESPPPSYNFARIPMVSGVNPMWEEPEPPVASGLRVERRELLISTVAAAIPEARDASPTNSIWPFFAAIATSVMLIGSIFTPWAVVWGSLPVLVTLIGWFWPKATPEDLT
jgi:heme/copper-type cytochrome/quinol oxidase subunit 1